VLRRCAAREALLSALDRCDRLILLGDVIELRQSPVREALAAAAPVLGEIGEALGEGREIVVVPGNHDHHLAQAWLQRRARDAEPPPLELESAIDWERGETLASFAAALSPAFVRASYPGVWLRDDVYAMHGHFADRHTTVPMFERLGAGVMAKIVRDDLDAPLGGRVEDYEATLSPLYAWLHAVAQSADGTIGRGTHGPSTQAWRVLSGARRGRSWRRRGLAVAFPAIVAALNRAGLGPLRADVSAPELRRAGLRAVGTALARLDVRAPHVIFGHTHRAGPLSEDDRSEWRDATGNELVNSGCWVYEAPHLGRTPSRSPYRPGFCVAVADEGAPELSNLLDGVVGTDELAGAAGARRAAA
jgi:Calcineurin-like phosphoesterase